MRTFTIAVSTFIYTVFFFSAAGTVHATTGCNAIGWEEKHGVTGCQLYYPSISWMYKENIASGDGATGKFNPDRAINRAEFTKLVLIANGTLNPDACTTDPFPDVPKDAWFAPYVCAAKNKGIISGFPDGTFKPGININFANGSKILAKTFTLPINYDDATVYSGGESIWYRPYTKALLNKDIIAPTINSFDQSISRGEMAEMLYRILSGKNYFTDPIQTEDGDYLGYGFHPIVLEESVGIYLSETPEPPYVFTKTTENISYILNTNVLLNGYAFTHTVPEEHWSLSGLWEHAKPQMHDWQIAMFSTTLSAEYLTKEFKRTYADADSVITRYFGGRPGSCFLTGVEGDNKEYCIVDTGMKKNPTIVFVITTFYSANPLASSPSFVDAMFARIRSSMTFVEY